MSDTEKIWVVLIKTLRPILMAADGFILGLGAKMFTIAGPVIVYGVSASVVYGLIYWITTLFYNAPQPFWLRFAFSYATIIT